MSQLLSRLKRPDVPGTYQEIHLGINDFHKIDPDDKRQCVTLT
jgi:hypothetical protein